MFKWCRHSYDLIDKPVLPSAYEQAQQQVAAGCDSLKLPSWAFIKSVVFTFKCSKCGHVRQTQHSNP